MIVSFVLQAAAVLAGALDAASVGRLPRAAVGQKIVDPLNSTPPCFKVLLPGGGDVPGLGLSWLRAKRSFRGTCIGALPQETCSRSYDGPRTPADPVVALTDVLG